MRKGVKTEISGRKEASRHSFLFALKKYTFFQQKERKLIDIKCIESISLFE